MSEGWVTCPCSHCWGRGTSWIWTLASTMSPPCFSRWDMEWGFMGTDLVLMDLPILSPWWPRHEESTSPMAHTQSGDTVQATFLKAKRWEQMDGSGQLDTILGQWESHHNGNSAPPANPTATWKQNVCPHFSFPLCYSFFCVTFFLLSTWGPDVVPCSSE